MIIKLLAEGGSMVTGPALSQKLGPVGIPIPQVIQKVNEATKGFKGMKVPVEIDINPSTKAIIVKVFSPPVSELLKKELGIEKGSGEQKKFQSANASIEQIISITKIKLPNLLSRNLKTAVKSVAGTCASLGILIENKPAKLIVEEIEDGVYDKQISKEITETPAEKKKQLEEYFAGVKLQQDKIKKQEEAAKAAAEEKAPKTATAKPEEKK